MIASGDGPSPGGRFGGGRRSDTAPRDVLFATSLLLESGDLVDDLRTAIAEAFAVARAKPPSSLPMRRLLFANVGDLRAELGARQALAHLGATVALLVGAVRICAKRSASPVVIAGSGDDGVVMRDGLTIGAGVCTGATGVAAPALARSRRFRRACRSCRCPGGTPRTASTGAAARARSRSSRPRTDREVDEQRATDDQREALVDAILRTCRAPTRATAGAARGPASRLLKQDRRVADRELAARTALDRDRAYEVGLDRPACATRPVILPVRIKSSRPWSRTNNACSCGTPSTGIESRHRND